MSLKYRPPFSRLLGKHGYPPSLLRELWPLFPSTSPQHSTKAISDRLCHFHFSRSLCHSPPFQYAAITPTLFPPPEWTQKTLRISPVYLQFKDKHLKHRSWGAWVTQSVERPTSAQVMISWFVSSSPTLALCSQHRARFGSSVPPELSCARPLPKINKHPIN